MYDHEAYTKNMESYMFIIIIIVISIVQRTARH